MSDQLKEGYVAVGSMVADVFGMSETAIIFELFHKYAKVLSLKSDQYAVEMENYMGYNTVFFFVEEKLYNHLIAIQEDEDFNLFNSNSGLALLQ